MEKNNLNRGTSNSVWQESSWFVPRTERRPVPVCTVEEEGTERWATPALAVQRQLMITKVLMVTSDFSVIFQPSIYKVELSKYLCS